MFIDKVDADDYADDYLFHEDGEKIVLLIKSKKMDVELKFYVDDVHFSIDVRKNFLEGVKDTYKALTAILEPAAAQRGVARERNPAARRSAVFETYIQA